MINMRFKPKFDKLFWLIWIPTLLLIAVGTFLSLLEPVALIILIATDLFTLYFLLSSIFCYAELRENTLFVKFGFILKRDIPYNRIRAVEKKRKFYADSMLALKNSLEHVNIKYNTFDIISVSVVDNDEFIKELKLRMCKNDN